MRTAWIEERAKHVSIRQEIAQTVFYEIVQSLQGKQNKGHNVFIEHEILMTWHNYNSR